MVFFEPEVWMFTLFLNPHEFQINSKTRKENFVQKNKD